MTKDVKSGLLEFSDDQQVFVAVDEDDTVLKAVLRDGEGNETALGALPTDEQVQEAVDAWLDDHPEATTTVQDGAITTAKLANGSVTDDKLAADGIKAEVSDLKTDLSAEETARTNADNALSTSISNLDTHKVAQPLDEYNQPTDGTDGQLLRTKGDGSTEWVDEGLPTDAQTAQAVSAWLDEHPEATTTVEDGSLTEAKFAESLKLKAIKDYVTPEMFGAKGDGTTDDTTALVDCANYCATNNVLLYVPKNFTMSIPSLVTIEGLKEIDIDGRIKAPNGIEFRANSVTGDHRKWKINVVTGTLILSGIMDSFIELGDIAELILKADSSNSDIRAIAYNNFKLGYVKTLKFNGYNSGWINENMFFGGRITNLLFEATGTYPHNNNHFYNPCLEGGTIDFKVGQSNYIHNARFESMVKADFSNRASNNYVQRAWVSASLAGGALQDQAPSWWHDYNGNNYFTCTPRDYIKIYEKKYTKDSLNYNASVVYPLNGKLHSNAYVTEYMVTNKIPIDHAIGLHAKSDQTFFRTYIYLYDTNGDPIETDDPKYINAFQGGTPTWSSTAKAYIFGGSNYDNLAINIGRYSANNGEDTGIGYVHIRIYAYGTANVDYFYLRITTPWYIEINPFENGKLTSPTQPTNGDWAEGTLVYNTDPTNHLLGWFYNNGAWHTVGAY